MAAKEFERKESELADKHDALKRQEELARRDRSDAVALCEKLREDLAKQRRIVDEKEEVRLSAHRKTLSKAIEKSVSPFVRTLLFFFFVYVVCRVLFKVSTFLDFLNLFVTFGRNARETNPRHYSDAPLLSFRFFLFVQSLFARFVNVL